MNWFKKATTIMRLDWDTAYKELLKELGREPTNKEVRKRMYDDKDPSFIKFPDPNMEYNPLLNNDLEFK